MRIIPVYPLYVYFHLYELKVYITYVHICIHMWISTYLLIYKNSPFRYLLSTLSKGGGR